MWTFTAIVFLVNLLGWTVMARGHNGVDGAFNRAPFPWPVPCCIMTLYLIVMIAYGCFNYMP